MGGRYAVSLDWHCCWWHVSSKLLQVVEREEGRLKHSGRQEASPEGFCYSLVVKLPMCKYGRT